MKNKWWQQGWFWSLIIVIGLSLGLAYKLGWLFNKQKERGVFFGPVSQVCMNWGCLIKDGDSWLIQNSDKTIPADKDLVQENVIKIEQISLETVVSENKDRFESMGIFGQNDFWIEANDQKLVIGQVNNDYSGTFVKPDGQERVFEISQIIDRNNWSDMDFWKQKNLVNLPKYQISQVKVIYDQKEVIWEKDDEKIDKLAFLPVLELKQDMETEAIDKEYVFEVETEDGQTTTIKIGKRVVNYNQSQYWAWVDDEYVFEISEEDGQLLTEDLK